MPCIKTDSLHESPAEELFARHVKAIISTSARCIPQKQCRSAEGGTRRVDFALVRGDTRVGIECDGAEYHRGEFDNDRRRDVDILKASSLRAIIRYRAVDIMHRMDSVLSHLRAFAPEMMSTSTDADSCCHWFAANLGRRPIQPLCRFKVSRGNLMEVPSTWMRREQFQVIATVDDNVIVVEAKAATYGFQHRVTRDDSPEATADDDTDSDSDVA